jgi:hypothetical protein
VHGLAHEIVDAVTHALPGFVHTLPALHVNTGEPVASMFLLFICHLLSTSSGHCGAHTPDEWQALGDTQLSEHGTPATHAPFTHCLLPASHACVAVLMSGWPALLFAEHPVNATASTHGELPPTHT